ncbi:MAG: glycoside hydrolase family 92 protein, partial [Bacteroidetes bacterium]|nr:glycoside hydrolase family 92 protein [Bacteroidota bacterium]
YPVTPGLPVYTIGSPVFEKVTIDLHNGHRFKVIAHGCSRTNKYIQRALFNGVPLGSPWFTHDQLMKGGTLELFMGPYPNRGWGKVDRPAQADIRLPAIVGDNMVLQAGMANPIWGWAAPGKMVEVVFDHRTYKTRVSADGRWRLDLATHGPGGPFEMRIACEGAPITLHNILVGEVWLASGQSNMEFGIQTDSAAATTMPAASDSGIHFFYVPMAFSLEKRDTIAGVSPGSLNGKWVVCSPAILARNWAWHGPSAVGYYFSRELRVHTGHPVGLIMSYKGGTPAQAWISPEGLQQAPAFDAYISRHRQLVQGLDSARQAYPARDSAYQAALRSWDGGPGRSRPSAPVPPEGGFSAPSNLYNAMIAPLVPYGIKGVIWYQGESNGDRIADACEYSTLFPRLIKDWRNRWREGNFPFLFVQLANFRAPSRTPSEGIWPWVREAQLKALSLPATGMAVTIDIGDAGNIHPRDKYDAGYRLSLAARHTAYGEKLLFSGPLYRSMEIKGDTIRLRFSNTGRGLTTAKDTVLKGFGIAGDDRHFVWAKARLDGNVVVVTSSAVKKPVAVRYDWGDNPAGNLYNGEGLPAAPFRTDDWECGMGKP